MPDPDHTLNISSVAARTAEPDDLVPLELEKRRRVRTEVAAWHLGRKPATLRGWACAQNGPITPVNVAGRLLWDVDDIRALLGVTARAVA